MDMLDYKKGLIIKVKSAKECLKMKVIKDLKIKDLKIAIPIIQGGMGVGVSGWKLASSVANAGGVGIISGAQSGYREADFKSNTLEANIRAFREEIRKAKEHTKGVVGVNIMVAMRNYAELVKVAVEEKVDLIISGAGLPIQLPELVKGSTTKIVPIVSSLRAAQLIMKRWINKYEREPDAIVVEGPEAGGHLGFKPEELHEHTASSVYDLVKELKNYLVNQKLDIPVIAAGGIFDVSDIQKAMESGADGVQIASRFVATKECDASEKFKQAYIDAKAEDIVIMNSPVGLPGRALKNGMLSKVMSGERVPVKHCYRCVTKCDPKTTPFCITEMLINAVEGNLEESLLFVGGRVGDIQKMSTVQEIMDELSEAFVYNE